MFRVGHDDSLVDLATCTRIRILKIENLNLSVFIKLHFLNWFYKDLTI